MLLGVDDDDEVAGIDVRRVLRLVLALQDLSNLSGEPAEHEVSGVDKQPLTFDLMGLSVVGLHKSSNETIVFACSNRTFTGLLKRTLT